jgi:hypothetical protein
MTDNNEHYDDNLTADEIEALEKKQLKDACTALIPRMTEAIKHVMRTNPEFTLESLQDMRKQKMICDVAFLLSYDFESAEDRQETIDDIKRAYPWFDLVQNLEDLKNLKSITAEDLPVVQRIAAQLLAKKEKNGI